MIHQFDSIKNINFFICFFFSFSLSYNSSISLYKIFFFSSIYLNYRKCAFICILAINNFNLVGISFLIQNPITNFSWRFIIIIMIKHFSIKVKPNNLIEPASPKIFDFRIIRNNEKTYLKILRGMITIQTMHPTIPKFFTIKNDQINGYKNLYGQTTTIVAVFNLKTINKDSAIYQNQEFVTQIKGRYLNFYLYDENDTPITSFKSFVNLVFDIEWDSQAF